MKKEDTAAQGFGKALNQAQMQDKAAKFGKVQRIPSVGVRSQQANELVMPINSGAQNPELLLNNTVPVQLAQKRYGGYF